MGPGHFTDAQLEAVDRIARVDPEVVRGAMARVPPSWKLIQHLESGAAFFRMGLQVLFTVQKYEDGKTWIHVSACGRKGPKEFYLPTWEQMKRVKNDFVGADNWGYQVFPPPSEYVNHHEFCLHIFALLDGTPALPDFTYGLGTV